MDAPDDHDMDSLENFDMGALDNPTPRALVPTPKEPVHYDSINDIPIPLRHTLVRLSRDHDMTDARIAELFFLPVEWVIMFTQTPPGSPHH